MKRPCSDTICRMRTGVQYAIGTVMVRKEGMIARYCNIENWIVEVNCKDKST